MAQAFSSVKAALEATAQTYDRVRAVIPPEEWAGFAEDILAIRELKHKRRAVILAHNYMTPEIFHGVADITGDSLALARKAASVEVDVIVSAGVHFMAETAKLLNPSRTVLIPNLDAGCSLAESITPEDVRVLKARHAGLPVITYVNTSAAVKAECDICCTSGNAKQIVESLGVPEVIMVPDGYLGRNVAKTTQVKIILWNGSCEVHERFTAQEVRDYRAQHPDIAVIAHPECPPDVVAEADFAGSTVKMSDWVAQKKPPKVMLLTECSMSDNVAVDHPDIEFVRPCQLCPHMKKITLKSIRRALEDNTYQVEIPEAIATPARRAVQRMIEVPA
ncbi:MAG: quinolinate synthase NadA [Alphaproteobacteria bacterium]|nr:quinolinate synthase NadA [Alphaproteobacteria bacterium]